LQHAAVVRFRPHADDEDVLQTAPARSHGQNHRNAASKKRPA
jgi:hypothetical protein